MRAILLLLLIGAVSAAEAPAVGAPAPDFTLPSTHWGNIRLSEFRGQVVVLTFWSSACKTCASQLAQLDAQQRTYGPAGLVTLAISVDADSGAALDYARQRSCCVQMLIDAKRDVGRSYAVSRLPTTLLIDRSGRIRQWYRDYHRIDNLYISQLRALLDDVSLIAVPLY